MTNAKSEDSAFTFRHFVCLIQEKIRLFLFRLYLDVVLYNYLFLPKSISKNPHHKEMQFVSKKLQFQCLNRLSFLQFSKGTPVFFWNYSFLNLELQFLDVWKQKLEWQFFNSSFSMASCKHVMGIWTCKTLQLQFSYSSIAVFPLHTNPSLIHRWSEALACV